MKNLTWSVLIIFGLSLLGMIILFSDTVSAVPDWLVIDSTYLHSSCGGDNLSDALDGIGLWEHYSSEYHWFIIDLGSAYTITSVKGRSFSAYDPYTIEFYVSNSSTIFGFSVGTTELWRDTPEFIEVELTQKCGRYVKVLILDTDQGQDLAFGNADIEYPFSIFDVYGDLWVAPPSYSLSINATSPYDGENYAYQFPGWMGQHNVWYLNATLWASNALVTQARFWFAGVYVGMTTYYFSGVWYCERNIFAYYTGLLENGHSYTFWVNYSYSAYPNIYDNDSITFIFNDLSIFPLPLGMGSNWNLVSLPKDSVIPLTSIYIRNATNNYTWNQAVANGIVMDDIFGWYNNGYTINTTMENYRGYWMYFYYVDYEIWINTSSVSVTTPITLFQNIINAYGFHNYTLTPSGYNVYANYTGNYTDPNASENWLYLGAMLTLDNGQFFLIILIGLWSYFIYLFYAYKEVIFSFCIICCGLPLGIILSGVAYYNSYPFGYLISFILILISFLIPTYSQYQKNKKK